jgi:Fe-S-cluster containining protein
LVTDLEADRLAGSVGERVAFNDESDEKIGDDLAPGCRECPLLTNHGRCSQYDLRPLMCRLWGVVNDPLMICPFGCEPQRYLSNAEVVAIWRKVSEINRRYLRETQPENHATEGP